MDLLEKLRPRQCDTRDELTIKLRGTVRGYNHTCESISFCKTREEAAAFSTILAASRSS